MSTTTPTTTLLGFERISKHPEAFFIDITPAMAVEILKFNNDNRNIRKTRVLGITEQLNRKQWQVTGEAIKFAVDGSLLDGQHRLTGCVESGKTMKQQLIVTGLAKEAFTVLDSGLKRNIGDALNKIGYASSGHIAPVARLVQVLEAGLNPFNSAEMTELVTKQDIVNYAKKYAEELDWAIRIIRPIYDGQKLGNRTAWTALVLMALGAGHNKELIETFVTKMATGEGMNADSPILALRNFLIRRTPSVAGTKAAVHLGNYINAFNHFVKGNRIRIHRGYDGTVSMPALCSASKG